jgi:hypothetical protein
VEPFVTFENWAKQHNFDGTHKAGIPSEAIVAEGLDAEKGEPSVPGRLFWATDSKILYRDSGETWIEILRGETVIRLAKLAEKEHHSLDGLGDDDHTQYLNTTRHDTTDRHTLGTVVPHDALGSLTEKNHSSLVNVLPDQHHAKQHPLAGTAEHTSTIPENKMMSANASGLPADSGMVKADVQDAVSKKHDRQHVLSSADDHTGQITDPQHGSRGAASDHTAFLSATVRKLRATGLVDLTIADVPDGKFLKRSGLTIIGADTGVLPAGLIATEDLVPPGVDYELVCQFANWVREMNLHDDGQGVGFDPRFKPTGFKTSDGFVVGTGRKGVYTAPAAYLKDLWRWHVEAAGIGSLEKEGRFEGPVFVDIKGIRLIGNILWAIGTILTDHTAIIAIDPETMLGSKAVPWNLGGTSKEITSIGETLYVGIDMGGAAPSKIAKVDSEGNPIAFWNGGTSPLESGCYSLVTDGAYLYVLVDRAGSGRVVIKINPATMTTIAQSAGNSAYQTMTYCNEHLYLGTNANPYYIIKLRTDFGSPQGPWYYVGAYGETPCYSLTADGVNIYASFGKTSGTGISKIITSSMEEGPRWDSNTTIEWAYLAYDLPHAVLYSAIRSVDAPYFLYQFETVDMLKLKELEGDLDETEPSSIFTSTKIFVGFLQSPGLITKIKDVIPSPKVQKLPDMPDFSERNASVGVSFRETDDGPLVGYIGTGFKYASGTPSTCWLRDVWVCNCESEDLEFGQLPDFPEGPSGGGVESAVAGYIAAPLGPSGATYRFLVVGLGNNYPSFGSTDKFYCWDWRVESWDTIIIPTGPSARTAAAGFTINGKFYVCGGATSGGSGFKKDLWCLSWDAETSSFTWEQLMDLPDLGRIDPTAYSNEVDYAVVGLGMIMLVGSEVTVLDDMWKFSSGDGGAWEADMPFPSARNGCFAVFYDENHVFVIAGVTMSGGGVSFVRDVLRRQSIYLWREVV